jgi:hypothetical protein
VLARIVLAGLARERVDRLSCHVLLESIVTFHASARQTG